MDCSISNLESAVTHVETWMSRGADLRLQVARDLAAQIVQAARMVVNCLKGGGKVLIFGNGGSAADAQHLAAEFVGRFLIERRGLPAIALTTDSSILTAIGNDYGFEQVFSRQIEALGHPGDVALGISTSGISPNVVAAMTQCAKQRLKTIGLSGKDGGALAKCADISLVVRSPITALVQECHIAIGHVLCDLVETEIFPSK